jgi:hypothetical protein
MSDLRHEDGPGLTALHKKNKLLGAKKLNG